MFALIALVLLTAPIAFAQTAPRAETVQPSPRAGDAKSQLFQVVLLTASIDGPESLTGLPKNAEKAIQDIKDFLPYRSYRLLDSGLLRAVTGSTSSEVLLNGDAEGDREFRATLRYRDRDSGESFAVEQFILYLSPDKRSTPLPAGYAPVAAKKLIDTSFAIARGETVVVGSSKLNGSGKAVIVLLTALLKS